MNTLTKMMRYGLGERAKDLSNKFFYKTENFLDYLNAKNVRDWGKPSPQSTPRRLSQSELSGKKRQHGHALICGDFAEIFIQKESWICDAPLQGQPDSTKQKKKESQEESAARASLRAQKQVRRLCNTNKMRYMWTLTLAPPSPTNSLQWKCVSLECQKDYEGVRRLWHNFCNRLRRVYPNILWLVVFELHDSKRTSDDKRGTWHLHLTTPDRLDWNVVSGVWGHGVVRFDDFRNPKKGGRSAPIGNPGAYISKYIGKSFSSENLHRKRYSCSQNVKRPIKIALETFREEYLVRAEKIFESVRRVSLPDGEIVCKNITYKIQRPKLLC